MTNTNAQLAAPVPAQYERRQSPAKAISKRVAILRDEMQHCLQRCEELHDLHDAYLD